VLDARAAARLLATTRCALDLYPVARAAGCEGPPLPLDGPALRRIGIDAVANHAWIAAGAGALRCVLIDTGTAVGTAAVLAELAARLSRHAPMHLWLLVVKGRELAVAAWSGDRARPRVSSLVVDVPRVLRSDAETLAALAASAGGTDVLIHSRWLEVLGRDAITGRFYRALDGIVRQMADEPSARIPPSDRRDLALLHVTRLLFLSYVETKGWLDGDPRFLARSFERVGGRASGFQRRVLHPLYFGTLNTPVGRRAPAARALGRIPFLNGGLFARTALERRHPVAFSDDAFGRLFDSLLLRYRFTPREEQPERSEAAVDPEMLGRAFESLMAADRRRRSGAYYTPLALVERLVERGLRVALRGGGATDETIARALDGRPVEATAAATLRARLTKITVLDPACGSGAFLVHALERIAGMLARLGDPRDGGTLRRAVLARSIFGVDIDPTAVWLCELRLWLAVVVEQRDTDAMSVPPLPNLDRQIRIGDSLAGELPATAWRQPGGARIARLRERYARATGARKRTLGNALERAERARALARVERQCDAVCADRRELLSALRMRDLFGARPGAGPDERRALAEMRARVRALGRERRRLRDGGALPFAWSVHAGDVLDAGGFDLVVGNPPWVRLHRIPAASRGELRARYQAFSLGGWARGMELARAGRGFAGQVDLAALFTERSLGLARQGGAVAMLLPAKLWRSLAGGGVRRLLARGASLELLEDLSGGAAVFDAAVYPSALVARVGVPDEPDAAGRPSCEIAVHGPAGRTSWPARRDRLTAFPEDDAAPWLLLPPDAHAAFALLRDRGVPLAESPFGSPALGVKTGCNAAFTVRLVANAGALAEVEADGRTGIIERAMLRPLLRGESLDETASRRSSEHLIWTHGADGAPLRRLPPHAARWMAPHEPRLRDRSDLRGGMPWWSLFRTPAARCDRARLVWADVAREPRVRVLAAGDPSVPLNSCYVLACAEPDDARALAALLRSPPCAAWLAALAEPARGGYLRYLAWTVALLPIPRAWPSARTILLDLPPGPSPFLRIAAIARAFGLEPHALAPLVEWSAG
jgi:hypothetical protein